MSEAKVSVINYNNVAKVDTMCLTKNLMLNVDYGLSTEAMGLVMINHLHTMSLFVNFYIKQKCATVNINTTKGEFVKLIKVTCSKKRIYALCSAFNTSEILFIILLFYYFIILLFY